MLSIFLVIMGMTFFEYYDPFNDIENGAFYFLNVCITLFSTLSVLSYWYYIYIIG